MKKIIISAALIFFVGIFGIILLLAPFVSEEKEETGSVSNVIGSLGKVSPEVLAHRPTVEKYCKEFDIEEYMPYIFAIMQVESGGTATDVMQCSESLGLPPNTLDTEASIKQGCKYFSELLASSKALGCDLETVIQSYNYGGGFMNYVAKNGKKYKFELAEAFASDKSGGEKVDYYNKEAIAVNGGWRYGYGNMFYVLLVKQFILSQEFIKQFIWPLPSVYGKDWITSTFEGRYNPVTGVWQDYHGAIDVGAPAGTEIYAAADGVVILSEYSNSYGNWVMIEHNSTYTTVYAHASKLIAKEGQTVKQGDLIALVGTTGQSTGNHLHFEVRENGEKVNPMNFLD